MNRIVIQLKKRLDNIDFRKILKGFVKCNFLLKKENILYGITEEFYLNLTEKGKDYIIRNNIKYVVVDYPIGNFNYDDILIDIIVKMFKVNNHFKNEELTNDKLKLLTHNKNAHYYDLKYKTNLLLSQIISGNSRLIPYLKRLLKKRIDNDDFVKQEVLLEEQLGLEKYVKLKAIKLLNPKKFDEEIKLIITILEDPTKLFNYFSYVKVYGAAYLLFKNLNIVEKNLCINNDIEDLLINFENLMSNNNIRIRRLMMYKMIHAKKIKITGVLNDVCIEKVVSNDNLFYLPDFIQYEENGQIKRRKGDFLIKMNKELEILESYECLSIEKII